MSSTAPKRPTPVPDELTRPFWDAAAEGRLEIQRCEDCGYYNHPPVPLCDSCASVSLRFVPVSGRGRIYSFTTNYQKNVAGFEEVVPYTNLVVELEEQPRLLLLSDLNGVRPDWVSIGEPVVLIFVELPNGMALPQFAPAGSAGGERRVAG